MASSESAVQCIRCGDTMGLQETVQQPKGATIEVYACAREECQLRAVVIFEIHGGLSPEQQSWVEKEVARRGSFFPMDFTGSGRREW